MKGYSQIETLLTNLKTRGVFIWTNKTYETFERIMELTSPFRLLSFSKFSKPFVLECDAYGEGIGVVIT